MSAIPSKADPERQESFLENELKPLLDEEKNGKGYVFFVDAAHFVMGAFLGMIWCFERLFLQSSSGRKRYNVLGEKPFRLFYGKRRAKQGIEDFNQSR
jgi:hypothetical protein